jgi:hypothetical protein
MVHDLSPEKPNFNFEFQPPFTFVFVVYQKMALPKIHPWKVQQHKKFNDLTLTGASIASNLDV